MVGLLLRNASLLDPREGTYREASVRVEGERIVEVAEGAARAGSGVREVECGVRSVEHGNLIDAPTARLCAERGAFLVPTLVTYFALDELGRKLGFPEVSQRKVRDVLDAGLASVETAREAGLPMGFGTDLLGRPTTSRAGSSRCARRWSRRRTCCARRRW